MEKGDIKYTGGRPTETHRYYIPDLGYAAKTAAQIKNAAVYVGTMKLLKEPKRAIENGAYFYTRIMHDTRNQYGAYATVRGYKDYGKNGVTITFVSTIFPRGNLEMSEEQAHGFIQKMRPLMPSKR